MLEELLQLLQLAPGQEGDGDILLAALAPLELAEHRQGRPQLVGRAGRLQEVRNGHRAHSPGPSRASSRRRSSWLAPTITGSGASRFSPPWSSGSASPAARASVNRAQ